MIEILPYLGGLVTLLFSAAFYWALQELKEMDTKYRKDPIN